MSSDSTNSVTTEDLSAFSKALSDLLYYWRSERKIPMDFISFQLTIQAHDTMNFICAEKYQKLQQEIVESLKKTFKEALDTSSNQKPTEH